LIGRPVIDQLTRRLPGFAMALARRVAQRLVHERRSEPAAAPAATPAPAPVGRSGPTDQIPFVRIDAFELTGELLDLIPARLIHQTRSIPLSLRDRTLTVGMVDPHSPAAIGELRRALSTVDIEVVAVSADDWSRQVVRHKLDSGRARRPSAAQVRAEEVVFDHADAEREGEAQLRVIGDDVVRVASQIVAAAVGMSASDIHIEAESTGVRIRFRVAGMLADWQQAVPPTYARGLVARFKVLAGLDITERRRPQDGRIGLRVGHREIDLRVSTMPTMRGEKVVMRVFEGATMMQPLDQIFVDPPTLKAVREVLDRPYGAVVVAGPTGSGKSSTLYAALAERKTTRPDSNIVMIEDPVEYRLDGVTQIQVNHQIDLTFSKVLRSVLRQDPDVIMVGEIRDRDTSVLALEAAMTGHLLLTSVHANNAISVLQRLENLGSSRTAIAQSVALILVQRLVSRLCAECVVTEPPPPILHQALTDKGISDPLSPAPLPRSKGCARCDNTGVSGRIAVIESLLIDDELRHQLMVGTSLSQIERAAESRKLLLSFRQVARLMLNRGLISPSEALLAVT
jgi:type IV pilus assembly protein PilB